MSIKSHRRHVRHSLLPALCLTTSLLAVAPMAAAQGATANWKPVSSERLVKLPANYLKKAIDRDFAASGLATAIADAGDALSLKAQTLKDLQGAIEQAQGDLRVELQHQFLAEKQAYLKLVARHQELRRQRAETKVRVYENLLGKVQRRNGSMEPQKAALIQQQEAARQRFETTSAQVDSKLFSSTLTSQSKYAKEYAANVSAIEKLVHAIQSHPAQQDAVLNGAPATKADLVRQLLAENQAEISMLDQERAIVGFMAKLVSLDALALADSVQENPADGPTPPDSGNHVTSAVDLFVAR